MKVSYSLKNIFLKKKKKNEREVSFNELYSNFIGTLDYVEKFLAEFESSFDDSFITEKLPCFKSVYMDSAIINLSKLLNRSKCDKFGIKQLKNVSPAEIKKRFEDFEKENVDIISKIINNGNLIFAHTDPKFFNLLFSEDHIKDFKQATGFDISHKMASVKSEERYLPNDLKNDCPKIKRMIDVLRDMLNDLNEYYYSKTRL
jgi:hypothetical protein